MSRRSPWILLILLASLSPLGQAQYYQRPQTEVIAEAQALGILPAAHGPSHMGPPPNARVFAPQRARHQAMEHSGSAIHSQYIPQQPISVHKPNMQDAGPENVRVQEAVSPASYQPPPRPPVLEGETIVRGPEMFAPNVEYQPQYRRPLFPKVWGRAEYFYWWMSQPDSPPLVTTSNPAESLGIIGQPGTQVLAGGDEDLEGYQGSVGRFTVGVGLPLFGNRCRDHGFEVTGFFLNSNDTENFASNGDPVLARPFFDISTGLNSVQQVANPELDLGGGLIIPALTGSVAVQNQVNFWGLEGNCIHNIYYCRHCGPNGHRILDRMDILYGFRHLTLDEGLTIVENLLDPDIGESFLLTDQFDTLNRFYGFQVGVRREKRINNWSFLGTAKLGVGVNEQEVVINGSTVNAFPGLPSETAVGGLLAQSTNIGEYRQTEFALVPEISLEAGYYVTENARLYFSYNFLFWTGVARAAEQIDPQVNPEFIPQFPPATTGPPLGPAVPEFILNESVLWVQGIGAGLELRY